MVYNRSALVAISWIAGAFPLFYNFLYLFLGNRQFINVVFKPLGKVFLNIVSPSCIDLAGSIFSFPYTKLSEHVFQTNKL